jgi:asparagine synthase (glutamine-hydrolysing)
VRAHFGIWNLDGRPVDEVQLARARTILESLSTFPIQMLKRGALAILDGNGNGRRIAEEVDGTRVGCDDLVLWNGRLDNRPEVEAIVADPFHSSTDAELIQKGFDRFATGIIPRIVGDWAVSIVRQAQSELILAKDFAGTRPLFYRVQGSCVAWSSVLEPLVLSDGGLPPLSEEFLAAWISSFPKAGSTPYRGVFSVPPCSIVRISPSQVVSQRYWSLEHAGTIRYRTDKQYEEQFLSVFRESVRRRLDSPAPILAELSGGMDSSSIVCMCDELRDGYVDTVTYFDSLEPGWDEMPFAGTVEMKRTKVGHHIDIGPSVKIRELPKSGTPSVVPPSLYFRTPAAVEFDRAVAHQGYRAILSGIGGDEMLGGIPTPIPELADLLVRLKAFPFVRQSFRWALARKKSIFALWQSLLRSFLPPGETAAGGLADAAVWLKPEFRARNREQMALPQARFRVFGPLPSRQANAAALEVLTRQISCVSSSGPSALEWRYPFLDRDLVAFCASIPREQLVRPGQRRSLMRRALAGIVPQEILQRKRKAYVSRGLVSMLVAHWQNLRKDSLFLEAMNIVDAPSLYRSIEQASHGKDVPILPLLKTLALEYWMRDLDGEPFRSDSLAESGRDDRLPCAAKEILGRETLRQKGGDSHDVCKA